MMVANDTFVAAVFAAVVDFLSLPAQPCVRVRATAVGLCKTRVLKTCTSRCHYLRT